MNTLKTYWDNRYKNGGDSGYGSYGPQLVNKLNWIKNNIKDIKSICEIGCGDFNLGSKLCCIFNAQYLGFDISQFIVDRNNFLYQQYFKLMDHDKVPKSDLLVCVDVLFHITDEQEYERMLNTLKNKWTKYLVMTAYERDDNETASHVKIKKFNYKDFGEPIVREIVEQDGELYFYIFKK